MAYELGWYPVRSRCNLAGFGLSFTRDGAFTFGVPLRYTRGIGDFAEVYLQLMPAIRDQRAAFGAEGRGRRRGGVGVHGGRAHLDRGHHRGHHPGAELHAGRRQVAATG
jgi:hypothetical protein